MDETRQPVFASHQETASWTQEVVPYGIFTTDRDLRLVTWNAWLASHSGRAAAEVVGKLLTDLYPEIEDRRLRDRYRRALAGEVSVLSAALHKHLLPFPPTIAGSELPHMLQTARVAPWREGSEIIGTLTIIEDVTQREFQAAILNRQQTLDRLLSESLATLLQSTAPAAAMAEIFSAVRLAVGLDGFVSYLLTRDQSGLVLHSAVGVTPLQKEMLAYLPLAARDLRQIRDEAAAADGDPREMQGELLRGLGFKVQSTFPLAVGERPIGLVTFGSYARESIPSYDRKILSRVSRYVAIAIDRAARERDTVAASKAKDDFLAALSHELRTPLNPVLLIASDAAGNLQFPEAARSAFRVIERYINVEARLIDDLLDLTRISHGKLGVDLKQLDLRDVVRDALETLQSELSEQRLVLEVDLGPEPVPHFGDVGRLQQVFWNVLRNAIKFTGPGGRITVKVRRPPGAAEAAVTVADTGIGMEPEELGRIFAAFAQGDHAEKGRSQRYGGLGLGLAISRSLVELHGGRIEASSAGRGLGSTFTITLPLSRPPGREAPPAAGSPAPSPSSQPPAATAGRILVVEDHAATRHALALLLRRRGFTVTAVASAQAALAEARNGTFHLVLSDIGLPDEDGFTLMRKLRTEHGLRGIALTGYGMEQDLARSAEAGFATHLTKPVSVQVLDDALAKVFPPAPP